MDTTDIPGGMHTIQARQTVEMEEMDGATATVVKGVPVPPAATVAVGVTQDQQVAKGEKADAVVMGQGMLAPVTAEKVVVDSTLEATAVVVAMPRTAAVAMAAVAEMPPATPEVEMAVRVETPKQVRVAMVAVAEPPKEMDVAATGQTAETDGHQVKVEGVGPPLAVQV